MRACVCVCVFRIAPRRRHRRSSASRSGSAVRGRARKVGSSPARHGMGSTSERSRIDSPVERLIHARGGELAGAPPAVLNSMPCSEGLVQNGTRGGRRSSAAAAAAAAAPAAAMLCDVKVYFCGTCGWMGDGERTRARAWGTRAYMRCSARVCGGHTRAFMHARTHARTHRRADRDERAGPTCQRWRRPLMQRP